MKSFLTFLILVTLQTYGQKVPSFESNTTEKEKANSLVSSCFQNDFDTIISYTQDCYWPTEQWFFVLVQKNGKWQLFKLAVKFKDREKEKIIKTTRKKLHIDNNSVDSLFSNWNQNQFWTLDKDSLNWSEKVLNDSITILKSISDGCADRFEIITIGEYRIISSYLADEYQKDIPVNQRYLFILSRNEFFRMIIKNNSKKN